MAAEPTGIPVLILKEGTQRTAGKDALRISILAARAVAEMVKTTYGPKGMDKMLVDALGDVTITNDGATILDKAEIQHPAGKMLVHVAKSQDSEVGDGTKRAVIIAGELLKQAEDLLNKNIHPTVIVSGFRKAMEEALRILDQIAIPINVNDDEVLRKVARTSLTSKAVHDAREYFADIAVKAVKQVAEPRGDKIYVDIDNIQIIKKYGGSLMDTQLVYGIVLDKEVVHPGMPRRVEKARIALLDAPLEVEKPEITAKINITSPEMIKAFLDEESKMLKEMVDKIAEVGANVVVCQKGIDEVAQHFLAKKGILAVRRVKRSDLEKLERATGGKIASNIEDLKPEDLGYAELVEERKIGEDKMVFIEGCKNPRSVSIVIRGGLERLVDEAERSFRDALSAVADALKDGKIVAGGGAVEMEIAKHLRKYAVKVGGKEQLAIEAFARAIEGLVVAMLENAGLDTIDMIMKLRAAHEKEEGKWIGVDLNTGELVNMLDNGVVEPVSVIATAIKGGTEAATIVLRIDDIIAASKLEKKEEAGKKPEEEKKEED
ncbi:MAG: thermosome subunit beta [Desulfurococcaceae archaeon]